jgi:integrase
MASIVTRDDSPYYFLSFKDPTTWRWRKRKLPIRQGEPDAKRKCAMALAKAEMAEAAAMPAQGRTEYRGWSWVPAFIAAHYENLLSRQRAVNAWAALQVFIEERGIAAPEMVTFAHGHEYVAWRQAPTAGSGIKGRKKNTALLEVKIWSVIVQHAVRLGLALANPLFRLGIKRERAKVKPEISAEDQVRIEAALRCDSPDWMRDAWAVAMLQGCRLRQTACPMDRIDLERRVISLPRQKGKEHTMPLHSALVALVEKRRAEGAERLVEMPERPSKAWRLFFDKLGMGEVSFHSTRVTVNTRLLRAGFSTAQVMALVGHSREQTNEVYRRLMPVDVAGPLETLRVG